MTRVSKNIKKIRTEKKLTQDMLAEKISVTRQAVSSWENDRTQPDIDMLVSLSSALEVDIEELIYGEKRNIGLEAEKTKYRNTITVIFAILGSLFVGVGLVMLFVNGWKNFPIALKTGFAFVPLLASQAFAVFTVTKKKDSLPFREGAAVLWCAGVVATVALINAIYSLRNGYFTCLLIDGALCLPIMYLLGAVSPLAFCSYSVIHWSMGMFNFYGSNPIRTVVIPLTAMAMLTLVFLFIPAAKKLLDEVRLNYCMWIAVISGTVLLALIAAFANVSFLLMLSVCGILLFSLDENGEYSHLFSITGLLLTIIPTVIMSFGLTVYDYYSDYDTTIQIFGRCLIGAVMAAAIALNIKKKNLTGNPVKISVLACAFAAALFAFAGSAVKLFDKTADETFFLIAGIAAAFAMGICLLLFGAKKASFLYINLGFGVVAAELYALLSLGELDLLQNGFVFIALGTLLLLMNFGMAKKKKRLEASMASAGEDTTGEEEL